ncbi:MAG: hypothetical protein KatS3mg032_1485 [Cyclobacteriaceae bacterium]|nr:MAG: hypothetical protein KatS3mg032_1485 [Cyclobacteriaceae bacterium]
MKERTRSLVMFLLAGFAFYYGYTQRHEARVQRDKVQDLYRQIKTCTQQAEAARAEAASLRIALEKEKEAIQNIRTELNRKTSKH